MDEQQYQYESDFLSDPIVLDALASSSQAGGDTEILEQSHGMNPEFNPVINKYPSCASCQIHRSITHTNGMKAKRLEIHGALWTITHAVLGIYDYGSSSQTQDWLMFDFHKENEQAVKNFLVQYYDGCRQEGYSPVQESKFLLQK